LNILGGGIVLLWLFLIGVQIKKSHFHGGVEQGSGISLKTGGVTGPHRDWMEIYLKDKKVGYSMKNVTPVEGGYLVVEEIFLKLNLLGQASAIQTAVRCVVDEGFHLKNFTFTMSSGAVHFKATGRMEGNQLLLEMGEPANRRKLRMTLKGPAVIASMVDQFFKGRKLQVGETFRFSVFDPSMVTQKELLVKVTSREALEIRRIHYDTFLLEAEMWGQPMKFWVDQEGVVLKEEGFMGLTLVKSSAANAPRDVEASGGNEFYEMTAVGLKGKLNDPSRLQSVKLKVIGLDETSFDTTILNQGRQRYQEGIIEIRREKWPIEASYRIPYPNPSREMELFLHPELNIESDHPLIIEKAREIARNNQDPAVVARKLMLWVYGTIEKKPVVVVPNALEVMRSRVGDCNEHAVLLTALLRASGIPARLAVGIVFARGKFFYHAWTEGYVGKWITMDATLNQMPADVTHIKMVEGGLDEQVEMIRLMGKFRLEVSELGYE